MQAWKSRAEGARRRPENKNPPGARLQHPEQNNGGDAPLCPMPITDDSFLPTRSSLLSRLKNASDAVSWQAFVDNYGRLIFQVCLRAGLQRQEAEDVVQETVVAVAQQM